jgi:hypothetical protein
LARANGNKCTTSTIDDALRFNHIRGAPLYRSDNFKSTQQPAVQTLNHKLSGFIYVPPEASIKQVVLAAIHQLKPITLDYFWAANCVAVGFALAEELNTAITWGVTYENMQIPVKWLPAKPAKIHCMTLDWVPSMHPHKMLASTVSSGYKNLVLQHIDMGQTATKPDKVNIWSCELKEADCSWKIN